jgi:hypothetical protein
MAGGKKLGGCSAEQLSEAIYNNKIVIKKEGEEAAVVQEEATETTEPVAPKNPKPRYSLPQ